MDELGVGTFIDRRYVIRREISRGGMCVVYCAQHRLTGRQVALKMLLPEQQDDEASRRRLVREARAMELSRSKHVVEILDAGEHDDGSPYLVMEMLEGKTLEGVLAARQRIPVDNAVAIGLHVCRALSQAHARGVVHRDIKPGNIMFARSPEGETVAKLIDFGISAIVEAGDDATGAMTPSAKITRAGEFFGTPEYVAPESLHQVGLVDPRGDLYSLAVTLFECLVGMVPYSGSFGEVLIKAFTSTPPDAKALRSDIPHQLADLIRRGMAVQPADRFENAEAMHRALERVLTEKEDPARGSMPPTLRPPALDASPGSEAPVGVEQRRRHARAPFVTPVRISLADGSLAHGKSVDVSEGGLLVVTDSAITDGSSTRVRFMSPLSGKVLEVRATTRWVKAARGRAAVGFEFVELPEPSRLEIAEYVALTARGD